MNTNDAIARPLSLPSSAVTLPSRHLFVLNCAAGLGGAGVLTTTLTGGRQLVAQVEPHEVKLLLVLEAARREDSGLGAAGGWRSRENIGELLAAKVRFGYAPARSSLSAYRSRLRRKVVTAARALGVPAPARLIEARKQFGFRLAANVELEIIGGRRGQTECG